MDHYKNRKFYLVSTAQFQTQSLFNLRTTKQFPFCAQPANVFFQRAQAERCQLTTATICKGASVEDGK